MDELLMTWILSLRGALPLGAEAVSTWAVGDRASREREVAAQKRRGSR